MRFYRYLLLPAVCLFCLTCLVACKNTAPADQLTVVQGTVTNVRTGRPLPGVLVLAVPYFQTFHGPNYQVAVDSILTDAQGKYQLHFRNERGLYYTVSCETPVDYRDLRRLDFPTPVSLDTDQRTVLLTLGTSNTIDFKPSPRRVYRLHVVNRNTRYPYLYLSFVARPLRGSNLDSTLTIYEPAVDPDHPSFFYQQPGRAPVGQYQRYGTATTATKDTLVTAVPSTPLTGDTVRATLTFVR